MKKVVLIVALLGLLLPAAFAQGNSLHAMIPFDFIAMGKTLPAGSYAFNVSDGNVKMLNEQTGATLLLGHLTRIAAENQAKRAAKVSFDVQGGKHYIEAFWPEEGDGYLIHMVKGEHTHSIIESN